MDFTTNAKTATASMMVGLLALTGCGKVVEAASEKAVEAVVEAETGEDVDLDWSADDGSFTIEADGETFSVDLDEDGESVELTTETDEGDASYTVGGDKHEDWPESLPFPNGEVAYSTVSQDETGSLFMVLVTVEDPEAEFARLADEFAALGYEVVDSYDVNDGSFTSHMLQLNGEFEVTLGMVDDGVDRQINIAGGSPLD